MKKSYSKPSTTRLRVVFESEFLAGSYVNIKNDVTVETFKDGFDTESFGDDGFVVTFE